MEQVKLITDYVLRTLFHTLQVVQIMHSLSELYTLSKKMIIIMMTRKKWRREKRIKKCLARLMMKKIKWKWKRRNLKVQIYDP